MKSATSLTILSLGAAVAGALSLAAITVPAHAEEKVKCYGIAKAGENDCANKAAGHSCATESKVNYSGQDFKAVTKAACEAEGGSLTPFEGTNPKKAAK